MTEVTAQRSQILGLVSIKMRSNIPTFLKALLRKEIRNEIKRSFSDPAMMILLSWHVVADYGTCRELLVPPSVLCITVAKKAPVFWTAQLLTPQIVEQFEESQTGLRMNTFESTLIQIARGKGLQTPRGDDLLNRRLNTDEEFNLEPA
jgi:hypothetical protein